TLVNSILKNTDSTLIVAVEPNWNEAQWRAVDQFRSRMEGASSVVLVVTLSGLQALVADAPNLLSWAGGDVYEVDLQLEELSTTDRKQRLELLRRDRGLSDKEVIRLAEEGKLPADPEYGEWLLLLD